MEEKIQLEKNLTSEGQRGVKCRIIRENMMT
jgi:hypothetical protein